MITDQWRGLLTGDEGADGVAHAPPRTRGRVPPPTRNFLDTRSSSPGRPRTSTWCASDAPPSTKYDSTNNKPASHRWAWFFFSLAAMESSGARWDHEFGDDTDTRLVRRPYLYMNTGNSRPGGWNRIASFVWDSWHWPFNAGVGRKEDRPGKGPHKSVGWQRPHEQVTGQMGLHVSAGWAGGDSRDGPKTKTTT
jgi:hypothetical protein